MKFRVDRDAFADAVAWTARALPARPAVPVLAGMRLDVSDKATGQVRLSGFDYEVSARAAVDVEVEEPGDVLVSGRLLAEIARNLPDHPVELVSEGPRVLLTCGGASFTLLTLPIEDYPALPAMPDPVGSVGGGVFASAVRQVAPAASRDDTLPMLTGIHLAFSGDSLTLAATDRYRFAVREIGWRPHQSGLTTSALVPARTLTDTARSLVAGQDVGIALSTVGTAERPAGHGESMIGFDNAGRRTTTRLIDSEFVTYESRFPKDFAARAQVNAEALTEAVKRVALVADRSTPLMLSFSQGRVVLEAGSGDDAQAREVIEASYMGDDMRVAFGPHYFLDGLGAIESDDVHLGFTTPTRPAVISDTPDEVTGRPGFRYLVMPLRIT
ncbi:DNA polymerase III subunit beta [Marinactinospora thermotolerans]|uniref:Beta sliding clamp n=1 Tax=Marinactinospora thermotolerans DSM 45154 TaxID=1122192 RepID=A0A1T4T2J6_9ACTN|nr:DNA polymerase III subunit beta [Marinactinospora thermotolerans]SKA34734.1 DNA polymerase-3 subunit beta [Marinactinospora thermotolerans DSM 45154]